MSNCDHVHGIFCAAKITFCLQNYRKIAWMMSDKKLSLDNFIMLRISAFQHFWEWREPGGTISELLMMVLPYNATNAEDCLFFCRHHHQAKLLNLPPELAIASAVFLRSTTLNQDQNSAWKTLHLAPSRRRVNTSKFIELHRLSKKVAKYH